jgi:pectate disaccharide-lyase
MSRDTRPPTALNPRVSARCSWLPAAAALGCLVAIAGACGPGESTSSGSGGTTAGSGGQTPGSGGQTAGSGGQTGSGGAASGGAVGSGGVGTGGAASGGTVGSGGVVGTGGSGTGGAVVRGCVPACWIAPTGLDSNTGTQASPFQTLLAAQTYAMPGSTIWVNTGTYRYINIVKITKSGTAAAPINVTAVAGASPIFDFSLQPRDNSTFRGIDLQGDYWHFKGIEVRNAADNCINIGGSHNTIELVTVDGCGDTGLQITVDSALAGDATRGAFNTILNCDSHDNVDPQTGGENADGFAAKLYVGAGNVFRGCRSFNNSDDGWDFFAANDVITIDGSWSFMNGHTGSGFKGPNADGNGFKLGGAPDAGDPNMGGAVHKVTNSFAFENDSCGFVRNDNPQLPSVAMCGARANPKGDFCNLSPTGNVTITMTGAAAKAVVRNADGSLPAIR